MNSDKKNDQGIVEINRYPTTAWIVNLFTLPFQWPTSRWNCWKIYSAKFASSSEAIFRSFVNHETVHSVGHIIGQSNESTYRLQPEVNKWEVTENFDVFLKRCFTTLWIKSFLNGPDQNYGERVILHPINNVIVHENSVRSYIVDYR